MAQIDLKKSTLTIKDGGSNSVEVKIGEGNLNYTVRRAVEYNLNRGLLSGGTVRNGDEAPCEVRFDFTWEYIKGDTSSSGAPSVEDALLGINAASGWTSTDTDVCQPYCVDLELVYDPECGASGNENKETITFADFRYEQLDHDLRAGTIACTGHCNEVRPTSVRAAAS